MRRARRGSVDPHADVEAGRPVEVVFDAPAVHLFDSETGEALVHGIDDGDAGGEARDLQEPEP